MYIYKEQNYWIDSGMPPLVEKKVTGVPLTASDLQGLQNVKIKFPFINFPYDRHNIGLVRVRSGQPQTICNIDWGSGFTSFYGGIAYIIYNDEMAYGYFDNHGNYLNEPEAHPVQVTYLVGTDDLFAVGDELYLDIYGVTPSQEFEYAELIFEIHSGEVGMNIITGYVGEPHITAAQDRAQNQGCYGEDSYILNVGSKLAATASSATEIHIADGVVSHQGCVGVIDQGTYDVVEIGSGSQGYNRIDLIVCRYERNTDTNEESLSVVAIEGTPSSGTPAVPAYTQGDIQGGDLIADMPLYQVRLSGVSIASITKVAANVLTQAELTAAVNALDDDIVMTISENLLPSNQTIATMKQVYVEVTLPTKTGYTLIGAVPRTLSGSSNSKIMVELDMATGYLKLFNTHSASLTISSVVFNLLWKKN